MRIVDRTVEAIDRFQQRRTWLAFPFAVIKKFGDDRAGNLAALIAYYGFFSLFPLLLVLVSVLGIVLRNNPSLQQSILDSALRDFPVIGTQISRNIRGLTGNAFALTVGIVGTLWGGLGVVQAAQEAMNEVWDVPLKRRPNFIMKRVRSLLMLAVLGTITILSTVLSGFGTSTGAKGVLLRMAGIAVSLLLNLALYLLAFRILTVADVSWGDVFPGAAVAAVLWTALQSLGGYYVTHQVKNASEVYGTFAVVIGLLVWFSLGAQITLYAAEVNVVRTKRLWPRSMRQQPPLSEPDVRTLRDKAKMEERIPPERVDVAFDQPERGREERHDVG
jgi:YihY family inner membrane protein